MPPCGVSACPLILRLNSSHVWALVLLYIRVRANLARYVVMSDYMRCRHAVFIHKVTGKLCRASTVASPKYQSLSVAPMLFVFFFLTHISIPILLAFQALCVLIARRSAMPRYISVLYAPPYLAVKSLKVMRRRISIAAAIISIVVPAALFARYT